MKNKITKITLKYIAPGMDREVEDYKRNMIVLWIWMFVIFSILLYIVIMLLKHNKFTVWEASGVITVFSAVLFLARLLTQNWYGKEKIEEIRVWEQHRRQLISSEEFRSAYNLVVAGYSPISQDIAYPFILLGRRYQDLLQLKFSAIKRQRDRLLLGMPILR